MKKYIIITAIILIFSVILSYGYLNNISPVFNNNSTSKLTKTYNANGISFNYTSNWEQVNKTGKYVIAYIIDPQANKTDGKPGAVVEISKKASNGIPLEKFFDEVKAGASGVPGYKQLSDGKITVDNETAYEFVASGIDNGVEEQFKTILFEKNGYIYMIACGTRAPTYLSDEDKNFNMVIESFKVTA
ncbi:MAG: hypothetical protein HZC47_02180 [Methanobacterium sp.]|uniref:PsbP-related protein n=1 Tax=Methanobacterium sp. TaxID=2164 RepID=UPI003D660A69|nr:hypothetical protein [Methanobacterium sp.]